MLELHPWKLLKPRTAVNKPGRDWFNAVTRVLSTLKVRYGGPTAGAYFDRPNADGSNWTLVLPSPEQLDNVNPSDLTAFRYAWASATTINVYPGAVAIAGIGAWETVAATVTLSGATAYVYAVQTKSTRATIVAASTLTTYPQSTDGEFRWALLKFTSADGGTTYQLSRDCRHDIRLGAPV